MSHSFADDTQLYRHTKVRDVQLAKKDMLATIVDINNWSQSRGLKLNTEKSEIIWLGTCLQLTKLSQADKTLQLPDAKSTVRNLGIQLDSELSFDDQARICVKTCYYQLRRIKQIRCYVDQDCLRSLVHAFITSRLDYCNSLYAHCNVSTRQRLHHLCLCYSNYIGCRLKQEYTINYVPSCTELLIDLHRHT